jgi:hypothetical protein
MSNYLNIIAASRRRVLNPLTLSPALWLDASDDATLFDAASGGSLPSDGNDVARWEDKSGNNRHFTQSAPAACPHRQTNIQNGRPVVRFDGSDDFIEMVAGMDILRDKPGASAVAVVRYRTSPNPAKTIFFAGAGNNASALRFLINAGTISGRARLNSRNIDGSSSTPVDSTSSVGTTAYIQCGIANYISRTAEIYVNNTLEGAVTGAFQSSANTSNTDSLSVTIGALAANSTQFANIDLSELFVFDRAISAPDRNALHNYLAAKWGTP